MKYGAIDIGTNSMRLLLADVEGGKFIKREKFINTTRLGQGIDREGNISEESIDRNIEALVNFKDKCEEAGCDRVFCIGTAALRNAGNREEFVRRAKEVTGIDVEIVPGEREAILGYRGVVGGINIGNGCTLIIDIGGGSTEFIIGDSTKIYFRKSINAGALVLTERFITSMPEGDEEYNELYSYINKEISKALEEIIPILKEKNIEENIKIIGIGGTITSVSAINQKLEVYSMEKIHSSHVTKEELDSQIRDIRKMNLEERRLIKGLQPKRAEIILSGELILKSIIDNLSAGSIEISEYDNLEGIILEDIS